MYSFLVLSDLQLKNVFGIIVTVRIFTMMLLAFMQLLCHNVEYLLKLHQDNWGKVHTSDVFFFEWGLPVFTYFLIGVRYLLKQWQSCLLWLLHSPPFFLPSMQCFAFQWASPLWAFIRMEESIDSILHFLSAFFDLITPRLQVKFRGVLNVLQD